jgi:hypothetical protein
MTPTQQLDARMRVLDELLAWYETITYARRLVYMAILAFLMIGPGDLEVSEVARGIVAFAGVICFTMVLRIYLYCAIRAVRADIHRRMEEQIHHERATRRPKQG